MHRALQLDNLNRLPPAMRRAAKIAYSPNSTPDDISLLLSYLSASTEEEATQMLRAFYANLDPSRLPDEDHFDTESPSPETENTIFRAYQSLVALHAINFPSAIGPNIWPRAWPWTRFIHLYRDYLLGIPPQSEEKCCLNFLMFAGIFVHHPASWELILSTPGVRFIVAKAWPYVSRVKDPKRREVVFTHLGYFLADKSAAEPTAMAEFIEAAVGSYAALAELIVDHYFLPIVPDTGTVMDFMEVHYLDSVLDFLRHMAPNLFDHNTLGCPLGDFADALISQSIVGTVSNAARTVSECDTSTSSAVAALDKCFTILGLILVMRPDKCDVSRALDNGLLPFGTLIEERLRVYASYCAGESLSMKACDNLKAINKEAISHHVNYPSCVRLCMKNTEIKTCRFHEAGAVHETISGRAFLTLYNYSRGAVLIDVHPLTDEKVIEFMGGKGGAWEKTALRAARSDGRMSLDGVVISVATGLRYWVVPLRANSSAVCDWVQQMASELPDEVDREQWDAGDMIPQMLAPLIGRDDAGLLEIH
ncbi:hypothetical protein B0H13DRAFT_2407838 [Mycena leptocephala]|nr:hypothetical protein B0H13DRAFT_2407838 [Mycena leptocephala]